VQSYSTDAHFFFLDEFAHLTYFRQASLREFVPEYHASSLVKPGSRTRDNG
jgi:hypothetical protein